MKFRASINVKINTIIIVSLLLLGCVSIIMSYLTFNRRGIQEIESYRQAIVEEKKESIKNLVTSASSIVSVNYQLDQSQQSRGKVLDIIGSFRFGNEGKDFIYALDTTQQQIIQHPDSGLAGKSIASLSDALLKKSFDRQIEIAVQQGEGYDSFTKQISGSQSPVPMLSYAKYFPEWKLVIATTISLAEVEMVIATKKELINSGIIGQVIKLTLVILILIIGSIAISYFVVYGGIVKPIRRMINMLKDIAEGEGDLTKRIHDDSGDETEEMAGWFNQFIEKVQKIIKDVSQDASTLESSSSELNTLSQEMTESASQTSDKSNTVATAGEQMSSNMQSVAASMEETSTNINMVAAATEEMSSTINEIAENAEKARQITSSAVTKTTSASNQVEELGRAAREIGKVVETITEISSQVDLLALNATIEAARAGDAGKGFAVVANEIKELARQTAEATMEIKSRVESIQSTTEGTVHEINDVSDVVSDIDTIVSTIATAVEEQSATTNEIVNNVSQASIGLNEVNENVAQSSTVSAEIAEEIAEVNGASTEISTSCDAVNSKSEELSVLANNLNEMVKKFKV